MADTWHIITLNSLVILVLSLSLHFVSDFRNNLQFIDFRSVMFQNFESFAHLACQSVVSAFDYADSDMGSMCKLQLFMIDLYY